MLQVEEVRRVSSLETSVNNDGEGTATESDNGTDQVEPNEIVNANCSNGRNGKKNLLSGRHKMEMFHTLGKETSTMGINHWRI